MTTGYRAPLSRLVAVAALVAAAMLFGGQRTGYTAPQPSDVNVVNTPSVNVANTPTVNVASSAAAALWVQDALLGQHPFQAQATVAFTPGSNLATGVIAVPNGKRLIVENVSAHAALDNGVAIIKAVLVGLDQGGGTQVEHFLVMTPQASVPGVADYFAASEAMRAYAVGPIEVRMFRTDAAGYGQVDVTVTGSLVDAN